MAEYYQVLGVAKDATHDEIRKAYKQLALKFHPDKNNGDAAAAEKFKELAEAFFTVGDSEKRKVYDEERRGGRATVRQRRSTMDATLARKIFEAQETMSKEKGGNTKGADQGIDWCFWALTVSGLLIAVYVGVR
eukprot:TRINITY_DN34264_c0_g1_i1.p2 TRINITY_DN34264_c0_g1~~TRINITY_DN34264_c0_g1_i1.p2  ORF type:complete len:147 (+),score=39.03 TRINITY_DN34264_c0_g1_i1:42-443(+)